MTVLRRPPRPGSVLIFISAATGPGLPSPDATQPISRPLGAWPRVVVLVIVLVIALLPSFPPDMVSGLAGQSVGQVLGLVLLAGAAAVTLIGWLNGQPISRPVFSSHQHSAWQEHPAAAQHGQAQRW